MSQIMKAFMGVFMVLLMTISSVGILSGYLQVLSAQDLHARMIDEVENSHFYGEVLRECFQAADEKGYGLRMELYDEEGSRTTIANQSEIPSDTSSVDFVEITMAFPYQVMFLGLEQEHVFSGYAR